MCRSFLERPVPPATVDRLLDRARRAPSAGNTQGWAWIVLDGPSRHTFWQHEDPAMAPAGVVRAPVVILPLTSSQIYLHRYSEPDKERRAGGRRGADVAEWPVPYWTVDASFALMLVLLGAVEEGLGALFFALHAEPAGLLGALGVPPGWEALGAVVLGWPSGDDRPSPSAARGRRPLSEVVHRGRW